jgi:predicted nucleic acid-binding protein
LRASFKHATLVSVRTPVVAAELWESYPAASSVLAYPEAALAAARRARRLTTRAHDRAVAELDALIAELVIVGVDEALARRAAELADERALRGYDAVHTGTSALRPRRRSLKGGGQGRKRPMGRSIDTAHRLPSRKGSACGTRRRIG